VCRQIVSGSSLVRLSGIDWRVLKVTGHQGLLLADRVIGYGPYHQQCEQCIPSEDRCETEVTWEHCDPRRWLNGPFLDSLGKPLASRILRTKVVNGPSPVCGTPGGKDTQDHIFLLSMGEVAEWLEEKRHQWKKCAKAGLESDSLIAKNEEGGSASWWLRTPGVEGSYVTGVDKRGYVPDYGGFVQSSCGIRPAFWLNLEYGKSAADGAQQTAPAGPARLVEPAPPGPPTPGQSPGADLTVPVSLSAAFAATGGTVQLAPVERLKRLDGLVDYWTRPPSSAAEVDAVARQVAHGSADLVRLSGIDWRVLKVTGHQGLLLADRAIGTGPYHEKRADVTWERCYLRRWLNGPFLASLGQPLASRAVQVTVVNGPNPTWDTPGGTDTKDQVFLLSMEEAADWLAGERPRWERYRNCGWFKSDKLIAEDEECDSAWWWLRSPGDRPGCAAYVLTDGFLIDGGLYVSVSSGGARPAFWLNLES
jgi:hypothetical protein